MSDSYHVYIEKKELAQLQQRLAAAEAARDRIRKQRDDAESERHVALERLAAADESARLMASTMDERLAEAEAARDIADQQLTVICEGVNRRCGADNHQLPIVSLDRLLAAHARDRINLVAWVLRNLDDDVCLTGDCIHGMNSDCIESIIERYIAAATAAGGCDE